MAQEPLAQSAALSPSEESLLAIWHDVFARADFGIDDDFYELDGYSLLAARISIQARETFGVELPLDEIYSTPTVRELAAYIDRQMDQQEQASGASPAILTFKLGSGAPLFFVHGRLGTVGAYRPLCRYLPLDRPMYGLQSRLLTEQQSPDTTIPALARYCIGEMRKVQPRGPYYLIGYSLAGLIAFEMARQLRAAGEEVTLIALDALLRYDPSAPAPFRLAQLRAPWLVEAFYRVRYGWLRRARAFVRRGGRRRAATPKLESNVLPDPPAQADPLERAQLRVAQQAFRAYRPQRYPGRIVYVRCARSRFSQIGAHQLSAWAYLAAGGLDLFEVPGRHMAMIEEPAVRETASVILKLLSQDPSAR